MFLSGSSGTGKTLLLVNFLKIKVATYKSEGKSLKIILATYKDSPKLREDIATKYGIENLLREYQTHPKSMKQLSQGIITCKINSHNYQTMYISK